MKNTPKIIAAAAIALAVIATTAYVIVSPSEAELTATATASTADSALTSPAQGGLAAHDEDGDGIVYQDAMHPWIVLDEPGQSPDCGMDLSPVRVDGSAEAGTVKIDPTTMQNMGVRTAIVSIEPLGHEIRTTGRFVMDESGERGITLKVSGYIEKLYANYEGYRVRKGQPLLELYSPDLVATQEEYLLALRNVERLESSSSADDAQRLLEAARRRLAHWDLSKDQIRQIEESGTPQRTITFYARSSGEVMHTRVAEGDYVNAGQKLMDIVDISKIWLIVDVYEKDLRWVKEGTAAEIELPYDPGKVYRGRVDYIYHMLDTDLRAAKARIVLPGGHHAPMKPGMYATVRIVGSAADPMPVVPSEAVIRTGNESVVVLALGDGRFRPTKVDLGAESNGKAQILRGLEGRERVVISAQFLIDSEARLHSAINAMTSSAEEGASMETGAHSGETRDESSMDAGVQTTRIEVGSSGFEPQRVELKEGVPARLVFTRTTDGTCATQVQVPSFDVGPTDLPLNEPVTVGFTPTEDGTFSFACGMDMLKGTLVVTS